MFLLELAYNGIGNSFLVYRNLERHKNSLFLEKVDASNRVETALLCLAIITMHIRGREDLL